MILASPALLLQYLDSIRPARLHYYYATNVLERLSTFFRLIASFLTNVCCIFIFKGFDRSKVSVVAFRMAHGELICLTTDLECVGDL